MILVVNAGSSSVKVALFDYDLREILKGSVSEIGREDRIALTVHGASGRDLPPSPVAVERAGPSRADAALPDPYGDALALLLAAMAARGHPSSAFTAAAHRVVHGGATLTAPCRIDDAALAAIEACVPLAPLHNPANLAGIGALRRLAPGLPQFASFDTAFHATNPPVATTYALPKPLREAGLRRYGFHGISYASLVERLDPLPRRLLALHLGNGASLCAILDGRSVATSMGYSPLEGLVMGTRTGSIDGMAVLELARAAGLDRAADILNRESGLKALAGTSDMETILARGDQDARFAVEMFTYWAIRQAGSAIAAMGGLDALAFTGGIGEHAAPVRERIAEGLAWAGRVSVHVLPAQEERRIAQDALALLGKG